MKIINYLTCYLKSVILRKWIVILGFIIVLGLPILGFWQAIVLFFLILIIFSAQGINSQGQKFKYTLLLIIIAGIYFFPEVRIQEGHNIYLDMEEQSDEYYEVIPRPINSYFQQKFNEVYPYENRCDRNKYGCWRYFKNTKPNFAFSSNSFWQDAKYSRVVNNINFDSVKNFNGGFLNVRNEKALGNNDWYPWISDIKREQMPFFVMYEIPGDLAQSELCWKGILFLGRDYTEFSNLSSSTRSCKQITRSGQKIYALSLPPKYPLSIQLDISDHFKQWSFIKIAFQTIAILILLSTFIYQKKQFLIYTGFGLLSVLLLYKVFNFNDISFLSNFPLHPGGGDALTHAGFGHHIFYMLAQGNLWEAFRGVEDVFYFMPGARYFLAFAKLIFGDSNNGYLLISLFTITFFPLMLLSLTVKHWLAISLIIIWYFGIGIGIFNFDMATFADLSLDPKHARAEGLGYGFIIFSIYLIISKEKFIDIAPQRMFWIAILVAMAVICRPNLLIGGFLLLAYTMFRVIKCSADMQWKKIILLGCGFSLIALLPLHNYIYGGKIVFLTSAIGIPENFKISPFSYLQIIGDWLGIIDSNHASQILNQHWNLWLPSIWHTVLVIFLLLNMFFIRQEKILLIGWAAIGLQIPLLFWNPDGRYAILAWLLTAIFVTFSISKIIEKYMSTPQGLYKYLLTFTKKK